MAALGSCGRYLGVGVNVQVQLLLRAVMMIDFLSGEILIVFTSLGGTANMIGSGGAMNSVCGVMPPLKGVAFEPQSCLTKVSG